MGPLAVLVTVHGIGCSLHRKIPGQEIAQPGRIDLIEAKCFRNVSENRAGIGPEWGRQKDFMKSRESHKTLVFIGFSLAPAVGLEPTTNGLTVRCSTN